MQATFDATWRAKALTGDPVAVRTLAEAALQPLYAFCFYRVGRKRHLCEEVVQETLVRALRELANYDPARGRDNIFPWLTGLARNEIQRVHARDKGTVSLEALWAKMDKELLTVYARLDAESHPPTPRPRAHDRSGPFVNRAPAAIGTRVPTPAKAARTENQRGQGFASLCFPWHAW